MGSAITNTTQLSTFSIIRDIIRGDSTLSVKFPVSSFYEFEPNIKSLKRSFLPYFIIKVPNTDVEFIDMKHQNQMTEFNIDITMVMDYDARDNFTSYANKVIRQIESNETTFEAYGYFNVKIKLNDSGSDYIDGGQTVTGIFELTVTGRVER
jgi:hypothetical protein